METLIITKVIRVGNSNAIVIPRPILKALNIQRGDQMAFGVYADDVICVRKISQSDLRKIKPPSVEL